MGKNIERSWSYVSRRYLAPGATMLALFGVSGCGSDNETGTTALVTEEANSRIVPQERPGPSGKTAKALAASIAKISREVKGEEIVPGTFCENTNDEPQRMYSTSPARLIVNTLCQPPLGEPAALYKDPSFGGESVGTVRDGDVVKAQCIDTDGQATRNILGASSESTTWVKVAAGDSTGYLSEVNLGYIDDARFKVC